jgi:DNA-binding Xre family transcriptional regulator
MAIEDKLKFYILMKYKTVSEFSLETGIPNSTLSSIFTRGIDGAKIGTIIKICKALNLSVDALADGKLVEKIYVIEDKPIEVKSVIDDAKLKLKTNSNLTIDGKEVNPEAIESMIETLDISYEIMKRKKSKNES